MAEFIEVIKSWLKLCDRYEKCGDCPLLSSFGSCREFIEQEPEKAEELIMKLIEENK